MTAIYKRELKSYFQSMTGYVLIAFLVIFTGDRQASACRTGKII